MRNKLTPIWLGFSLAAALLATGCGGSLYKVKPAITAPLPPDAASAKAGVVDLHAAALLTDEESQDLFEVNLPLSGVLPVRIDVVNTGDSSLELAHARFAVRDGGGRKWKAQTAKQTVKRVMKFYDVYAYNPASKKEFVQAMQRHEFDQKTPIAPGERRTGFVFFQSPGKERIERPSALIMAVEKLPQSVEIKLN